MRSGNLIKIKMKRIMKPSLFRKTSLAYKTCEPFDQKHQIYIYKKSQNLILNKQNIERCN